MTLKLLIRNVFTYKFKYIKRHDVCFLKNKNINITNLIFLIKIILFGNSMIV